MLGGRCNREAKLSRITLDEDLAAPVQLHSYACQQPTVRFSHVKFQRSHFCLIRTNRYDAEKIAIILNLWKQADRNAEAQLDHAKVVQRKVRQARILA
jgi:hypothetical protein